MKTNSRLVTSALRIHSIDIDASKVTKILKTEPTNTKVMGTLLSPRNPNSAACPAHLWILDSKVKSTNLEDHITELIDFAEQKKFEIQALSKNCEIDIFCGFSLCDKQSTFSLNSRLLKRIATLHLELIFNLYVN